MLQHVLLVLPQIGGADVGLLAVGDDDVVVRTRLPRGHVLDFQVRQPLLGVDQQLPRFGIHLAELHLHVHAGLGAFDDRACGLGIAQLAHAHRQFALGAADQAVLGARDVRQSRLGIVDQHAFARGVRSELLAATHIGIADHRLVEIGVERACRFRRQLHADVGLLAGAIDHRAGAEQHLVVHRHALGVDHFALRRIAAEELDLDPVALDDLLQLAVTGLAFERTETRFVGHDPDLRGGAVHLAEVAHRVEHAPGLALVAEGDVEHGQGRRLPGFEVAGVAADEVGLGVQRLRAQGQLRARIAVEIAERRIAQRQAGRFGRNRAVAGHGFAMGEAVDLEAVVEIGRTHVDVTRRDVGRLDALGDFAAVADATGRGQLAVVADGDAVSALHLAIAKPRLETHARRERHGEVAVRRHRLQADHAVAHIPEPVVAFFAKPQADVDRAVLGHELGAAIRVRQLKPARFDPLLPSRRLQRLKAPRLALIAHLAPDRGEDLCGPRFGHQGRALGVLRIPQHVAALGNAGPLSCLDHAIGQPWIAAVHHCMAGLGERLRRGRAHLEHRFRRQRIDALAFRPQKHPSVAAHTHHVETLAVGFQRRGRKHPFFARPCVERQQRVLRLRGRRQRRTVRRRLLAAGQIIRGTVVRRLRRGRSAVAG